MTTETIESDSGLPTLSTEEEAFFSSGGETGISDTGSDPAGGEGVDGGNPGGETNPTDQDGKSKDGKGEPKHVPLSALQEERTKRKALGDTVKNLETQLAEMRGKFSILDRLNEKPGDQKTDAPAAPPSVEEDIFGAVKHVGETLAQMQKRLDDEKAANEKKTADEVAQQTFVNNYKADAAQFETKNPDYKQAYNFLLQTRASELIAIGYDDPMALQAAGAPIQEVQAAAKALHDALIADEKGIADLAFGKKKSPAQIIYDLAKQRGYKAAAKPADTGKGAEKLDTIERGQQVNKSLTGAGGSDGGDQMTAERLLAMPLDEFEAWTAKNPAKAKRIMGG
jgi:hypothetical protein